MHQLLICHMEWYAESGSPWILFWKVKELECNKSRWALDISDSHSRTSMVLWRISYTLAEINMGYGNKHVYGQTWSTADERFIRFPLMTHLVAKFMAV